MQANTSLRLVAMMSAFFEVMLSRTLPAFGPI
jgi:hypothetical protein